MLNAEQKFGARREDLLSIDVDRANIDRMAVNLCVLGMKTATVVSISMSKTSLREGFQASVIIRNDDPSASFFLLGAF